MAWFHSFSLSGERGSPLAFSPLYKEGGPGWLGFSETFPQLLKTLHSRTTRRPVKVSFWAMRVMSRLSTPVARVAHHCASSTRSPPICPRIAIPAYMKRSVRGATPLPP